MRVGYCRVSTAEQNVARQEELMQELNVEKVYIDKASGKSTAQREALREMLSYLREGDVLIVSEISRLARNTRDLLEIVDVLQKKGVQFVSKKEAIDTSTPQGRFMLTVFGAQAELERAYILQRQREGIEIAKQKGKYLGRKPIEFDRKKMARLYPDWKAGKITARAFMKELNLQPATFYRRLGEYENAMEEIDIFSANAEDK